MSIKIEQTFQAGSLQDMQHSVETFDENENNLDDISESNSASGVNVSEVDWNATPTSDDSWPQSDDSWERQPTISFADEYEARMAALDQEAEDALNTGAKKSPDAPAPVIFIDTLEKMDKFLPVLSQLKNGVELAFDCEGTPEEDENGKPIPGGGFGRTGDISFLSMTVISIDITYVFDVWELKRAVFDRQNNDGLTLKKILESHDRIQLWWDVRSDWDTLFHKFGIQIGKLREKTAGGAYFQRNGWRPLTIRPLTRTARNYIAGDTECLYGLHKRMLYKMEVWLELTQGKTVGGLMDAIGKSSTLLATIDDLVQFIDEQSMIRAHDATSPGFDSRSREGKADAPAAFLRITDAWEENQDRISMRQEEYRILFQNQQSMAVDS
ncbi:uncharacterized protein EAF01_000109 [Botrytis porri]|uniref:3'-5' exonuclease domain-containing protein n=1 Tax=Botrytis porri TaxID=87229 RepID=A0A4Z1L2K6_9HELO|nr:uncharacterized protein EAF01_000109 [Botrytis porri]KAF7913703.1 hypothetical protein EAF01_000109 [Botrytis porri]TGO91011.1 hypothetical protein BPOR_0043g00220 [Botrytis porri]